MLSLSTHSHLTRFFGQMDGKYAYIGTHFDKLLRQKVHDHRDSERPMWMIKLPKPLKHSEIWDYNISDMNEDVSTKRNLILITNCRDV